MRAGLVKKFKMVTHAKYLFICVIVVSYKNIGASKPLEDCDYAIEFRIGIMRLIVLLSLVLLDTVRADSSVLLKIQRQKVTSSTLKWVPHTNETILRDAVVGSVDFIPIGESASHPNITDPSQLKQINIHICRTRVDGKWIPGTLSHKKRECIVSLFEKVYSTERQYEVLLNADQAARVIWTDWSWDREIPLKSVSVEEYFIAHIDSPNVKVYSEKFAIGWSHWIGKIDPQDGLNGRISVVSEDKKVINGIKTGQVLVEVEPVMYELAVSQLTKPREKLIKKELNLGEVTLRNDLPSPMKAESIITFQWLYNSSWGQGKGMLRGLNTRIFLPYSNETEEIKWGLQKEEVQSGFQSIEADLAGGTAVHVVLKANLFAIEVLYTGSLLSVFEDAQTMKRTLTGTWLRTALVDIEPHFGPVYFMHNNSVVPTTTTTTTTTTEATSTPSTTASTTEPSAEATANDVTSGRKSNSSSLPPREITNNSVINDGSDAMQLKEKKDPNIAASVALISYYCLIGSLLITTIISRC